MIDVNAQIDAVERVVGTEQTNEDEVRVQTLTQTYPSPIDDVWDAVTSAERIARWFLPVEGELRPGGRYQLVGNAGGEVLECTPPAEGAAGYRVTWEYGGGVSWVAIRLSRLTDDTTRFTLTHRARVADLPPGFWEIYGPGATGVGWDQGLLGLSLHLTGSAAVPPEQAEAWMLGDEGRSFARAAANGWAAAQIADGADPDAAQAAADATFAFYTTAPEPSDDHPH